METTEIEASNVNERKKIFVAGATGSTGKRIVEQLLAKGFAVKAGVRDVEKAKTSFSENPSLEIVSSFKSLIFDASQDFFFFAFSYLVSFRVLKSVSNFGVFVGEG